VISKAESKRIFNVFNNISFYRMYLASLITAIKFLDDHRCGNLYYSKVGGIAPAELMDLELNFLKAIDFDLLVSTEAWDTFKAEINGCSLSRTATGTVIHRSRTLKAPTT
jgi:hypothetical protein